MLPPTVLVLLLCVLQRVMGDEIDVEAMLEAPFEKGVCKVLKHLLSWSNAVLKLYAVLC